MMGAATAILFVIATFISSFLIQAVSRMGYDVTLILISLFIGFLLPGLALFGPPYLMGKKYGMKEGGATLIIGLIVIVLLLFSLSLLFPSNSYPVYY